MMIHFLGLAITVGCAGEQLVNHGDLSGNKPCMEKKSIQFEQKSDGFYLSDDEWAKFIRYCS